MFDPIAYSKKIKELVVKDNLRKYYRFRSARYYGGIATADCVGCNLSCIFCWSKKPRKNPSDVGRFYSPEEVVQKITGIAKKNGYSLLRISGNEPTIGKTHLLKVLQLIHDTDFHFILETNGILLGYDEKYASELAKFKNMHVRISLKGCNPEHFSKLTGALESGFTYQLHALRNLINSGVSCHPAILIDFFPEENLAILKEQLDIIDKRLAHELELEKLILYPHVKEELKRHDFHF